MQIWRECGSPSCLPPFSLPAFFSSRLTPSCPSGTSQAGLNWTPVLLPSSRCPHSFQQQRSFRKASRKPESKKVEEDLSRPQASEAKAPHRPPPPPHWEQPVGPSSPRAWARLGRPLLFTVGVRRCCRRSVGGLTGANAMSVHRFRLRRGRHLAVRILEVSGPDLL